MPLQNRVSPTGEICVDPQRGAWMGNRGGCFHDARRRLTKRRWASRAWITCLLSFKGRRRQLMMPGKYTELFFLDEATALSAGHRPCAECRRHDFMRFATLWNEIRGNPGRAYVTDMDEVLHAQRWASAGEVNAPHIRSIGDLPRGVFVRHAGNVGVVKASGAFAPWQFGGYARTERISPRTQVEVVTPRATVAILQAGYDPQIDGSAG